MNKEEIIDGTPSLTTQEKMEVKAVLDSEISKSVGSDTFVEDMILAASTIVGEDILTRDRRRKACFGRAMVSYRLRKESYTVMQIGSILGRDHSTITHSCKYMANVLDYPNIFQEEYVCWKEFIKIYPL